MLIHPSPNMRSILGSRGLRVYLAWLLLKCSSKWAGALKEDWLFSTFGSSSKDGSSSSAIHQKITSQQKQCFVRLLCKSCCWSHAKHALVWDYWTLWVAEKLITDLEVVANFGRWRGGRGGIDLAVMEDNPWEMVAVSATSFNRVALLMVVEGGGHVLLELGGKGCWWFSFETHLIL